MATLRDIKKRIGTVKNTQKITKAMKMVAAAKLRRAQSAVIGSRPYADNLKQVVTDIAQRSSSKNSNTLFVARDEVKKVGVIVFSSNRGLCGGFNSNLMRRTDRFLKELKAKNIAYHLIVVGKKGRDFMVARHYKIDRFEPNWADAFSYNDALDFTENVVNEFSSQKIDEFYLMYNQFKSAISQEVTLEKLLPVAIEEGEEFVGIDYLYEPKKEELLDELLPKYLATQVYKAHLESVASELGSRMSAMDNATKNASEMISSLTLRYNRARQAAITTELMDIVNGAEAIS